MDIQTFGVIGAGQMGAGIAQVAATSGLDVVMHDIKDEFVDKGLQNIKKNLDKDVKKTRKTAKQAASIVKNIHGTTNLEDLSSADFVVEAATERQDLKFGIFRDLDKVCKTDAILSTNTSSIPIGRIASQTDRPEKIIGMHFMNPVPIMKLVEVIRCLATSDETFDTTWALCKGFQKTPAEASDYPGFIANRVLMPMINEAIFCLYQGVGTNHDIDTVMKLGMNHPIGPLALADLIGLDTCLAIMETLYQGFSDSKYRPCPLLRKYVEAGWLGRKSGKGFYTYE
ncbi:MAG: 3-hydroxybutyryl-CoA dehydrogenase [Thermodesulfobacteriota bacterium]|nr:3-hydroxybutyryl-CoA dehydrogenase [Thermodesulfobacteriota bacterium]